MGVLPISITRPARENRTKACSEFRTKLNSLTARKLAYEENETNLVGLVEDNCGNPVLVQWMFWSVRGLMPERLLGP